MFFRSSLIRISKIYTSYTIYLIGLVVFLHVTLTVTIVTGLIQLQQYYYNNRRSMMILNKRAEAGTLEKSDVLVQIEPGTNGIELNLKSKVMSLYGKQITKIILKTLERLGVKNAQITVSDNGALDCIIKSRVECSVFRAAEISGNLPWGTEIAENSSFNENLKREVEKGSSKNRLRRTMLFLNAHRAKLVKDAYIYKPDCLIFDLEDAVSANQKDSARITLYNILKNIDYQGIERVVRINGWDTPHAKEDIRAAVAGGIDVIRVPKTETPEDIHVVESAIEEAEKEFGVPVGRTLMMGAIESPLGVINAYSIAKSSDRIMGISIGAGDYMRTMHSTRTRGGLEMLAARTQLVIAARAAGVMCFDTVHIDFTDMDWLAEDVQLIRQLGFDGKSLVSPKHIPIVHKIFTPTLKEIAVAEKEINSINSYAQDGVGVFTIDGQMVDIAMMEGAKRIIALAKASGVYKGDL